MTTKRKRNRRWFSGSILLLITAALLTACGAPTVTYPEDALATGTPQMIGLKSYVSSTETALTMTVTDAFRIHAETQIALIDAASFPEPEDKSTAVIEAGYVTREQLAFFLPEGVPLVTVDMTGAELREIAERNVEAILSQTENDKPDDKYVHFSGVGFVYNKKNAKYMRIVDSVMATKSQEETQIPLDDEKTYSVAMTTTTAGNLKISDARFTGEKGDSLEAVCAFVKEYGVVSGQQRFMDKADLDAPMITTIVLIVIAAVVLTGIVVVYFVMKNKQKQAKKRRGGEPRIDV